MNTLEEKQLTLTEAGGNPAESQEEKKSKRIPKPEVREARRQNGRYKSAARALDREVLEERAAKNFRILDRVEAVEAGHVPLSQYSNYLVLEKGKVFGWFLRLEDAQVSIKAKVIKNTIPNGRPSPKKKPKLLLGYNTAK